MSEQPAVRGDRPASAASESSASEPTPASPPPASLPTPLTVEALIGRLSEILGAMREEEWLPLSLRAQLTSTYLDLRQSRRYYGLTFAQARAAISGLALSCYPYSELTALSRTLRLVRILDMELSWPEFHQVAPQRAARSRRKRA